MSVTVMAEVWQLDLPTSEKLCLMALADHAHDDGSKAYPGVPRLTYKLRPLTRRTVKRLLRKLEAKGLIVATAYREGGRGKATEYQVIPAAGEMLTFEEWLLVEEADDIAKGGVGAILSERVTPTTGKGDTEVPERVTSLAVKGDTDDTPTINNHQTTIINHCGEPLNDGRLCTIEERCWLHGTDPDSLTQALATMGTTRVKIDGRSRWLLWEAVELVCRSKAETEPERGRWSKALNDLAKANATPRQVFERAVEWRSRYQRRTLTPTALSANWGSLAHHESSSGPVADTVAAVRAAARAATDATARTE